MIELLHFVIENIHLRPQLSIFYLDHASKV